MFLIRLVLIALLLLDSGVSQSTTIDLLGLNVDTERIPQWYPFDETDYDAAQSWTEYDVTCVSGSCPSGKTGYGDAPGDVMDGCTTVTTSNFGMNCMIAAAPDDSVLYLPAGTYSTTSAMLISRSNVVIRGAGRTSTVIQRTTAGRDNPGGDCTTNDGAMVATLCPTDWTGSSTSWTGGYAKGDTVLEVTDATLFSAGGWVRVRMSGSTACSLMDETLNLGVLADGFVHIAKVTGTNTTGQDTITIDRPIRFDYDASGCTGHEAVQYTPIVNVGIEKLRLTTATSLQQGSNGSTQARFEILEMTGVAESWIVNTQIDRSYEYLTNVKQSARLWFQGNDFKNLSETASFAVEGVYFVEGAVDIVVENNTCDTMKVCHKLDNGTEGIVIAYNYYHQGVTWCNRSMFNHGHFVRDSLFEGNDVDCEMLMADIWWGKNGPGHVAYRNRNVSTTCNEMGDAITVDASGDGGWLAATYLSIIGNTANQFVVAPKQANPACPPSIKADTSWVNLTDHLWLEKNAYRLIGHVWNIGNDGTQSCGSTVNDTCPGTNKNVSAPDASWNETYPTSLYRSHVTEPSWWCEEACVWDQSGIGAFGDDFGDVLCKLPAQIRAEGGDCTTGAAEPPPPAGSVTKTFQGVTLSDRNHEGPPVLGLWEDGDEKQAR